MKLILLTSPYFFVEEHQILNSLFDEGLNLLHLRKPNSEPVYNERLIKLINENYRKRIVIHDHFYMKDEYNLKGIHLNSNNPILPPNYKGQLSCTCSNIDDLPKVKRNFNYVFLNNAYPSLNSKILNPIFSKVIHTEPYNNVIDKKVMALGSVSLKNIHQLRDFGFGGVVIYSDIWNRFDIHNDQDYKDLISHFRKIKKATE